MIQAFDKILDKISTVGIVICVFLMLTLTLSNIVMRWFEYSVHWVEPVVRHTVFLAAFLGGSLATGNRHHIKIDVLSRILENSKNKYLVKHIDKLVTIITLIATVILTKASLDLVEMEFEFGKNVFLGIHSGALISIIPFGMGLISLRLFLRFLLSFKNNSEEIDSTKLKEEVTP